jgi:hypothetical protein
MNTMERWLLRMFLKFLVVVVVIGIMIAMGSCASPPGCSPDDVNCTWMEQPRGVSVFEHTLRDGTRCVVATMYSDGISIDCDW